MYCIKSHIHFQVSPSTSEIFNRNLKIECFYPGLPYGIRKFWCWTFTQHTSFYLTSYVTDMNYITHRRFFVHLYQPIHWYLTRNLTFLSEQRAPFSTMFASRAFYNVIRSQHSNVQVSIFVTCLNFAGTGSRLWQLYVAFV